MSLSTIYLLTIDDWSHSRVVGAFTSHEKALARAKMRVPQDTTEAQVFSTYTIEAFQLDVEIPAHAPGYRLWHVEMFADGCTQWAVVRDPVVYGPGVEIITRYPNPTGSVFALSVNVWATDEPHAIQITNENRIRLLAANGLVLPGPGEYPLVCGEPAHTY